MFSVPLLALHLISVCLCPYSRHWLLTVVTSSIFRRPRRAISHLVGQFYLSVVLSREHCHVCHPNDVVLCYLTSPLPEEHLEPQAALRAGYSESKWVAETLLECASETTEIHVAIVRVGQFCGDSVSGGWTTKKWLPALLRSSQYLCCIPRLTELIYVRM